MIIEIVDDYRLSSPLEMIIEFCNGWRVINGILIIYLCEAEMIIENCH